MHPGLTVDMSLNNRFVDLVEDGLDLAYSNWLLGRLKPYCPSYIGFTMGGVCLAVLYR